jgi:hypothetical protein
MLENTTYGTYTVEEDMPTCRDSQERAEVICSSDVNYMSMAY